MPVIRISDTVYERLQKHATPFVDTPATVIERLLDAFEGSQPRTVPNSRPCEPMPPASGKALPFRESHPNENRYMSQTPNVQTTSKPTDDSNPQKERWWEVKSGTVTIPCYSRLDSKSGDGRLECVEIFGFNRSNIVRALGRAGYKSDRARRLMDALGLQAVRTSSICTWISKCQEGLVAELTAEQMAAFDRLAPAADDK